MLENPVSPFRNAHTVVCVMCHLKEDNEGMRNEKCSSLFKKH